MKYYTRTRKKTYKSFIIIILTIFVVFNLLLVIFDRKVMPEVLEISKTMMKAEVVKMINKVSIETFDENVVGEDIVIISKDKDNNINLIQANTVLLNKITGEICIKCNERLEEFGARGIEVPFGWMIDKSIYYNLGPKITVEMEPLGDVEASYDSVFESAGINQTRHKIYLNLKARIKIVIPMYNTEMEVKTQIPLSETIIVGEIPDTAIDLKK
ncbi:sporulation protein YunB [Clostridium sp.]|uniref:sporulation protein YunB n=1 Tax=Clostridium sp. TaxID=1506 RepID=UPI002A90F956|nr:sporulation protein YunB [Clostridium sp.]MDY6012223.1 sporulation protein YunB [Clostridium sp.]